MSYAKVNFRRIPDLNFNGNKKLKKKKKQLVGIMNLVMREAFLNRTENSDPINEKSRLFDNT